MNKILVPGYVLQGRYVIVRQLGAGGMGSVYLAQDRRLNDRFCAVKEMRPAPDATPAEQSQLGQQFEQEAAILAGLAHTHLPKVFDYFVEGAGTTWLWTISRGRPSKTDSDKQVGRCPKRK